METQAFNSDPVVCREITRLRDLFQIKCVIETGSFHGDTTYYLGQNFERVYSIEITDHFYDATKEKCKDLENVTVLKSSSEKGLELLLPIIKEKYDTILFYLDAHWENYWPLQDELMQISKNYKDNCIIVIDDFYVPNRNFQFDKYHDSPCDLQFIKKELDCCFTDGDYLIYYLNKSERSLGLNDGKFYGVGKIYVVSGKLLKRYATNQICFDENGVKYSNII